jgi:hypothetical protein
MAQDESKNWILVYDLRRDRRRREQALSGAQEQWDAYRRGEWPVRVAEGRISNLFFDIHDGRDMFEVDEGKRRSAWARQGDDSWYALGWRAKIEHALFHAPAPVGDVSLVTRIWIGTAK